MMLLNTNLHENGEKQKEENVLNYFPGLRQSLRNQNSVPVESLQIQREWRQLQTSPQKGSNFKEVPRREEPMI